MENKFSQKTLANLIENGKYIRAGEELINFVSKWLNTTNIKYTDAPGDNGVDAIYFFDKLSNKVIIFQLKMILMKNTFTKEDYRNHKAKIRDFISDIINGNKNNSKNESLNILIQKISNNKIRNIEVVLFTTGKLAIEIETEDRDDSDKNIQIEYKNYDYNSMWNMIDHLKSNKDFNDNIKGKALELPIESKQKIIIHEENKGYTIAIKLKDLQQSIMNFLNDNTQLLDSLTHKNVRDFLGTNKKYKYNEGIKKTASNNEDGKYFYAYHMGMVMIGESLSINSDNSKITILSPSFVNGAQSLGSIMQIPLNEISPDAEVNIKIISFDDLNVNAVKQQIDKIVLRTNSANPITWEMQYAFDNNQKMIAQLFLRNGYLYEYRYNNTSASDDKIKNINSLAEELIDNQEFSKQQLFIKKTNKIKPHDVCRAVYLAQTLDNVSPYNKPDDFKYETGFDFESNYAKSFYEKTDDGKLKIRDFNDYFAPLAIHEEILKAIKKNFKLSKNIQKQITRNGIIISSGDAKTLSYFITAFFYHQKTGKGLKNVRDYYEKNDIETIMNDIDKFVEKFRLNLERPNYEPSKINNFIFSKIYDYQGTAKFAKNIKLSEIINFHN